MIRFVIALLLSGYVLSIPIDPEIKDKASEVSTPVPAGKLDAVPAGKLDAVPAGNLDTVPAEKTAQSKQESDLETEPSVWYSYHHSFHSILPPPLILPRPRVYTSYYAAYAPYYWSTW